MEVNTLLALKDDKFHRLEAAALSRIIDGLSKVLRDGRKLLQQTNTPFDGLHALLSKDFEKARASRRKRRRTQ